MSLRNTAILVVLIAIALAGGLVYRLYDGGEPSAAGATGHDSATPGAAAREDGVVSYDEDWHSGDGRATELAAEDEEDEDFEAYLQAIDEYDRRREEPEANGSDNDMASRLIASIGGRTPGTASAVRGGGGATDEDKERTPQQDRAAAMREADRMVRDARQAIALGNYAEAAEMLKESLELNPHDRDAYRSLANVYQKLGLTEEAGLVYEDWIAQRPNDATPYYQQAKRLQSQGRNEDALAYLQTFQQLTRDELSSYPMAASMYRKLNMKAEERTQLQTWVSQAPDSVAARNSLAKFYMRNGNKQAAVAEYQTVAGLTPENASAYRNLAGAYQAARMYDDAANALVTAMDLQPGNMAFPLQLGDLYRRTRQFDAALQTYYSVIHDAPDSTEAARARRHIARIERQMK
ncbi:MAG: tetratricopeptide repeat protein [Nitrospiraceae bacterium]|nr:tetratricopeptide repeat protein [Nitrospiraceae bacterium]